MANVMSILGQALLLFRRGLTIPLALKQTGLLLRLDVTGMVNVMSILG